MSHPGASINPMDRHAYVDREHVDGCAECGQHPMAPIHRPDVILDGERLDALGFAELVARLDAVAHDLALRVPAFRWQRVWNNGESRPLRTVRRDPAGPVVTVYGQRDAWSIKRDMAVGLCEANGLHHDHPKRWTILDRMELA